jgi:Arc/MetJ-type ribon-helix-helix transcriptional regulator
MKRSQLKQLINEVLQETQAIQPTPEQKEFAVFVSSKIVDKLRKLGIYGQSDVIRDTIAFHLAKQGWTKTTSQAEKYGEPASNGEISEKKRSGFSVKWDKNS